MKLAAKAAEPVALAEIKAIEQSENSTTTEENPEKITLTLEEYSSLKSKAQDAEELCNMKALEAALQVDEANVSKMDTVKRVEEAMDEVETSKQALEDALNRVVAANRAKLGVEAALRKWRSEHGDRRRSIQYSTKFKNPYPSNRRRESWVLDVNGVTLVSDAKAPVLKSTLSIGQILSQKLLITEEFESGKSNVKTEGFIGSDARETECCHIFCLEGGECCGGSQKQLLAKRNKLGSVDFQCFCPSKARKRRSLHPQ